MLHRFRTRWRWQYTLALVLIVAVGVAAITLVTRSTSGRSVAPISSPSPSLAQSTPSVPVAQNWPNAQTTGVPVALVSTLKHVDDLDVTQDGASFSHLYVEGCVDVDASHVTITQSIIRCAANRPVIHMLNGETNLVVDQVELDGAGKASACIAFANFTITRSNLHDCADGVDFTSNVTVAGCYVHDLARGPTTHNDAVQTPGGHDDVIRDNTLQAYRADTRDPMNAAVQTGRLDNALSNVTIRHNYMDGGNYTVNAGGTSTDGHQISNYLIEQNVFGRHYRYGPLQGLGAGTTFATTNVWADNGRPVLTDSR